MSDITHCFENLVGGTIDREKGIIKGVSVITIGPAKGHGLFIDRKSLETVKQVADEFKNGVKFRFRHRKSGEYQSVVEEVGGLIKNFSIDGNKLRGDLYLLDSIPAEEKTKIFEMAEKMSDQFGLSIDFSGTSEEIGEKKFARCQELQSIDLTDSPAANPTGLFSSMSDKIKYKDGESGEHHSECMCGKCSSDKKTKKMEADIQSLTSSLQTLTDAVNKLAKGGTASTLTFTATDGSSKQLSADEIAKAIGQIETFKMTAVNAEKNAIISRLQNECRVVYDPENPGTALTVEQLQAKDISFLKFAAANSQILPTQAKGVYKLTGNGPKEEFKDSKGEPLKGDALVQASLEAQGYGDIRQMIANATGKN